MECTVILRTITDSQRHDIDTVSMRLLRMARFDWFNRECNTDGDRCVSFLKNASV